MNKWIKEYQCPGCIADGELCFKESTMSISCSNHVPGTIVASVGTIFLGLPSGFNRIGPFKEMKIEIFETFEGCNIVWGKYDKFNVPVWKYKNEHGHIIVRGISPRINSPFFHIFLEDCNDKIDCLEIYEDDIKTMD